MKKATDRRSDVREIQWFEGESLRTAKVARYCRPSRPDGLSFYLTVDGKKVREIDVVSKA